MPGSPARFTEIVYRSFRYICTGSSLFSPSGKATLGVAGPAITSHCLKASLKSRAIRRRTLCACR